MEHAVPNMPSAVVQMIVGMEFPNTDIPVRAMTTAGRQK
jgi:hypothetical protein